MDTNCARFDLGTFEHTGSLVTGKTAASSGSYVLRIYTFDGGLIKKSVWFEADAPLDFQISQIPLLESAVFYGSITDPAGNLITFGEAGEYTCFTLRTIIDYGTGFICPTGDIPEPEEEEEGPLPGGLPEEPGGDRDDGGEIPGDIIIVPRM